MPYEIKTVSDGFKVCKQSDMKECYSKRGLPYKRALAQMRAIYASESGRPNPQLKKSSKKGSRKGSTGDLTPFLLTHTIHNHSTPQL